MADKLEDSCVGCLQKNQCKAAWHRVGDTDVPPVWTKVFVAFVLPLAALVVGLVLTERLARGYFASETTVGLISLAGAVVAAAAVMLLGRLIMMHFMKTTGRPKGQG
ncbi:MAG TPA: hypothetical protein VLH60_01905 [Sedimentisphaerales bacterium]|nr:hypothetical protein [Sedimentisphaerales bacterium]